LASGVPPSTHNLIFSTIASTPVEASGPSHGVQPQNTRSTLQLPTFLNTASHHPSIPSPPFPAVTPTSFKAPGLSYDVGPQIPEVRVHSQLSRIQIIPGAPGFSYDDVGPQNTRSVHQLPTILNPMSQYPSPAQTSWAPHTSSSPPPLEVGART